MNKLNHIAFIMDGNGRWGKKRGKGRNYGHLKGVETVKKIVQASIEFQIPIITFYVFSSENWKRPKNEKLYLFCNSISCQAFEYRVSKVCFCIFDPIIIFPTVRVGSKPNTKLTSWEVGSILLPTLTMHGSKNTNTFQKKHQ